MTKYKCNWAVEGMKRRRQELVAEIKAHRKSIDEIKSDIDALDRALTICGYRGNPKELSGKRVYRKMFKRGELQRLIFSQLREGYKSEQEISDSIVNDKGWSSDIILSTQVQRRVRYTLTRMAKERQVERDYEAKGEIWLVTQGGG